MLVVICFLFLRGGRRGLWRRSGLGLHSRRRFRRGRGRSGCFGGRRCAVAIADSADNCIYLDRTALGNFDVLKHAGSGRGNLGVHLIGGDFEERLVALDLVSGLLQPLGDGSLKNRFPHLGHDNISRHNSLPSGPPYEDGWADATFYYSEGFGEAEASVVVG